MDLFTLKAITGEMQQVLQEGRISRVSQPSRHDLILFIKTSAKLHYLLISISPQFPRMHLLETSPPNLVVQGTFCQYLRKHLIGAVIQSITQNDWERVVAIELGKRDPLGRMRKYRLIIEIMAKYGNVILIDPGDERILEAMKRVDTSMSRKREVLPGHTYAPPPGQEKIHPGSLTLPEFIDFAQNAGEITANWLVKKFSGYYKVLAEETIHRWKNSPNPESLDSLWRIMQSFVELFSGGKHWEFAVYPDAGKRLTLLLSPFTLHHLPVAEKETFELINDAAQFYYANIMTQEELKGRLERLRAMVNQNLQKERKKYEAIMGDISSAGNAEPCRIKGDLIFAHLSSLSKGMKRVSLPNLFSPDLEDIEIDLDPRQSPVMNAQRYHREAAKAKKSLRISQQRLELVQSALSYSEQLLYDLEEVQNLEDLEAIREEMQQQGRLKEETPKGRSKKPKAVPASPSASIRRFPLNPHCEIYAGKNNRGNDYLISRVASKEDLWFHARGIPGSHVIIRSSQSRGEIAPEMIETAARLAAYYSRGRTSTTVEVDYTKVKYVKKIKAGGPGLVTYDNHKTIRVHPASLFHH